MKLTIDFCDKILKVFIKHKDFTSEPVVMIVKRADYLTSDRSERQSVLTHSSPDLQNLLEFYEYGDKRRWHLVEDIEILEVLDSVTK